MTKNLKTQIAIIGGGFSGLSVTAHLLDKGNFNITLFEDNEFIGPGVAFGTTSPYHPLNVPAARMGAYAGKENDFYTWLTQHESEWRDEFKQIKLLPSSFLPRKLYALYLKSLFAKYSNQVDVVAQDVVKVEKLQENQLEIHTRNGATYVVDFLVLALGPTFKHFSFETAELLSNPRYTHNIWEPHEESIFGDPFLIKNNSSQRILLIGSGLTAVDTIISLEQEGFRGEVVVVTKSGGFSIAHLEKLIQPYQGLTVNEFPRNALKIVKFLRKRLKESGVDWREFLDGLKPITAELWRRLDLHSKKQFLRHLLTHWNRHRHRMSPESAELINRLQKEGRLKLVFGSVSDVYSHKDRLEIKIVCEGKEKIISVDHVINCAGQDFQIKNRNDLLLNSMLKSKLIELDDLGLGLKTDHGELLAGDNGKNIFALGALLYGERFETTAVPEIRQQASSIAEAIGSRSFIHSPIPP